MTGIYKIESPTGKVYIGQSIDIGRRFWQHQKRRYNDQPKLELSLIKHGNEAHKFSVIHELPIDVSPDVITVYEQFCIDQYDTAGIDLLNIKKIAGNRSPHSPETRMKMSNSHKGKSQNIGFKHSEETKRKMSISSMGQKAWNKGMPASEETRKKLSIARRKWEISEATGKKISEALKGRPKSEQHKERLRQANLGKKAPAEVREKMSISQSSRKRPPLSQETKRKISLAHLDYQKRRRENVS